MRRTLFLIAVWLMQFGDSVCASRMPIKNTSGQHEIVNRVRSEPKNPYEVFSSARKFLSYDDAPSQQAATLYATQWLALPDARMVFDPETGARGLAGCVASSEVLRLASEFARCGAKTQSIAMLIAAIGMLARVAARSEDDAQQVRDVVTRLPHTILLHCLSVLSTHEFASLSIVGCDQEICTDMRTLMSNALEEGDDEIAPVALASAVSQLVAQQDLLSDNELYTVFRLTHRLRQSTPAESSPLVLSIPSLNRAVPVARRAFAQRELPEALTFFADIIPPLIDLYAERNGPELLMVIEHLRDVGHGALLCCNLTKKAVEDAIEYQMITEERAYTYFVQLKKILAHADECPCNLPWCKKDVKLGDDILSLCTQYALKVDAPNARKHVGEVLDKGPDFMGSDDAAQAGYMRLVLYYARTASTDVPSVLKYLAPSCAHAETILNEQSRRDSLAVLGVVYQCSTLAQLITAAECAELVYWQAYYTAHDKSRKKEALKLAEVAARAGFVRSHVLSAVLTTDPRRLASYMQHYESNNFVAEYTKLCADLGIAIHISNILEAIEQLPVAKHWSYLQQLKDDANDTQAEKRIAQFGSLHADSLRQQCLRAGTQDTMHRAWVEGCQQIVQLAVPAEQKSNIFLQMSQQLRQTIDALPKRSRLRILQDWVERTRVLAKICCEVDCNWEVLAAFLCGDSAMSVRRLQAVPLDPTVIALLYARYEKELSMCTVSTLPLFVEGILQRDFGAGWRTLCALRDAGVSWAARACHTLGSDMVMDIWKTTSNQLKTPQQFTREIAQVIQNIDTFVLDGVLKRKFFEQMRAQLEYIKREAKEGSKGVPFYWDTFFAVSLRCVESKLAPVVHS